MTEARQEAEWLAEVRAAMELWAEADEGTRRDVIEVLRDTYGAEAAEWAETRLFPAEQVRVVVPLRVHESHLAAPIRRREAGVLDKPAAQVRKPEEVGEVAKPAPVRPKVVPAPGSAAAQMIARNKLARVAEGVVRGLKPKVVGEPKGEVIISTENSLKNALACIPAVGISCGYDVFKDQFQVFDNRVRIRDNLKNHTTRIRDLLLTKLDIEFYKEHVRDAIETLCLRNSFDSMIEWYEGLRWDGRRRIDRFLVDYFGVEDSPLARAIGRAIHLAIVLRQYHPGTKFDITVVLEGVQGIGKSRALAVWVGRECFTDARVLGRMDWDQEALVRGKVLVEFSDMLGLSRSQLEETKAYQSRDIDATRKVKTDEQKESPRRFITIGTTNLTNYLTDPTGNRRWYPFWVNCAKWEEIERDRDQLWAEAVAAFKAGESCEIPEELWGAAAAEAAQRLEENSWQGLIVPVLEDIVAGKLRGGLIIPHRDTFAREGVAVATEYLTGTVLDLTPRDLKNSNYTGAIAAILRGAGWTQLSNALVFRDGRRHRAWFKRAERKGVEAMEQETH
jgi:putative DNA primase/helicase